MAKKKRRRLRRRLVNAKVVVEPGTRVDEPGVNDEKLNPPPPLPSRKLTTSEVTMYVAHEGLGFCVYEYIDPEKIADPQLRVLWRKARRAMQEVTEHLEDDIF